MSSFPSYRSSSFQGLRGGRTRRASYGSAAMIYDSELARNLSDNRGDEYDTYITSLVNGLSSSLSALGGFATPRELEDWAIFIHECTSHRNRDYHDIGRLFEISAGADPVQLIAIFFRDIINCSVDGGLSENQQKWLKGVVSDKDYVLPANVNKVPGHPHLSMIMAIFGLTPGQDLSQGNQFRLDVFLSAVVVTNVLRDTLEAQPLAKVVTCLEATIPFRGPDTTEELYKRLGGVNDTFSLEMTQADLIKAVQVAADVSNRSLGNFSTPDASIFLDHTWSLLPEHNAALRKTYLYTVHDFQVAVKGMYDFLMNLDPSRVFTSFRGVPAEAEMTIFTQATMRNIDLGRQYVRAELFGVTLVAAFAVLTGGDAPMSFFLGDLPSRTENAAATRVADCYPASLPDKADCDQQVHAILKSGRHSQTRFDSRSSPLAAYIYASLGDTRIQELLAPLSFPLTDGTMARTLLASLPRESVEMIGRNIGTIAITRAERIETLLKELSREAA